MRISREYFDAVCCWPGLVFGYIFLRAGSVDLQAQNDEYTNIVFLVAH